MSAGRSGRISDELPFLFLSLLFFFFLRKFSQSPMYYECRCVGVHKKPTRKSRQTLTSMAILTRSLRPRFFPNNNNLSELASSSHLFQTSRACASGAVEVRHCRGPVCQALSKAPQEMSCLVLYDLCLAVRVLELAPLKQYTGERAQLQSKTVLRLSNSIHLSVSRI